MQPGLVFADQFEIERPAGSGGMGIVYRALDRQTGEPVALKVLHGRGLQDADRFLREALLLSELQHPGIVRYVGHGTTRSGERYLAIEWLEGESLSERLSREGLTVAESVTLTVRVAEALSVAHAAGVVHRDLKPSNLFLPGGRIEAVKVLDFGIARMSSERHITLTGALLGTPGYIAPEQARGEREIDARADVFSLGCVLFKCLTGKPAFSGDDVLAVLLKVALEEVPRISQLRDDVPEALDNLVARMLAKLPAERPSDAAAVAEALRSLGPIAVGRPAAISTAPVAITTTERQVMCLVLARLAHTRIFSEAKTMPEAKAEARERALKELAEKYGGTLSFVADGTLLVTFTGAATDQTARAARCALAMRPVLGEIPMAVVTGRGVLSSRVPLGKVIERGARLLAQGGRGRIRLDDVTAGLLDAQFDVGGDSLGLTLRSERDIALSTRTLLGRPTPCVGRDRELAALEAIFEECSAEPVARAALVIGAAGIGKSRLRYEFVSRIKELDRPIEVWMGRGDPMSAGSPFGMIGGAIRRGAGVLDGEPIELRRQKLRARLGRHLRGEELQRITEFIGELTGVAFPSEDSVQLAAARDNSMLMGDQMRRAWEDWLAAECAAQPTIIVLEDLHWGDLPTVKFIDASLRNLHDRPLMVLALARPEVEEIFPKLWAGRPVTQMVLGELTRRASVELVQKALGVGVASEKVTRVVERAAGNAFYLEELIRAVAQGKDDAFPETVLAMAQARLEGLPGEARRVLRAASLFGQVFWLGGVASLLGKPADAPELRGWLDQLVDQEVVTRRPAAKFPGEEEFTFRHALMREAAYAMLTDGDRVLGHRLAGAWLEGAGEGEAMVLAEHLERGGKLKSAVIWYVRAAAQALEGNDFEAARTRAEHGVTCGAEDEELGELRLIEAEAHQWRGEHGEADASADLAMEALPRGSPLWYGAMKEAVEASGRLGNAKRLVARAEELEEVVLGAPEVLPQAFASTSQAARQLFYAGRYPLAERLIVWMDEHAGSAKNPAVRASIHAAHAVRALCSGDPSAYVEAMDRAAKACDEAGDLRRACMERVNIGGVMMELGAYAEAVRALQDGLEVAQQLGIHTVVSAAKCNLGLALARQGRIEEAIRIEREAIEMCVAQSERRMEGASLIYLATIHALAGDLEAAEREARRAVEVLSVAPPAKACALATLASALLARGLVAPALEHAEEAMALLDQLGTIEEGESLVRLVHAQALHEAGRTSAAQTAIAAARERLLFRATKISDRCRRDSFLALPENARTIELARAWETGRPA
jgi:predicted ATPase